MEFIPFVGVLLEVDPQEDEMTGFPESRTGIVACRNDP